MGMEFTGSLTESEALDLFNLDKRFDIILMDIHLGTETIGYDAARKILEIDLKAIIVSLSWSDSQLKRALEEGIVVDHFDKLANPSYLCQAIYEVLNPTSRI